MARQLYQTIGTANPTPAGYETAINALLAPLLSVIIKAFDIVLTDKAPASTRILRTVVGTETTGAVTLTSPFLVKAFQGEDEASAIGAYQTFIATIPGYFISPVMYYYSDQAAGQNFRVILVVVYCADFAGGTANWQASGGGGGSGNGQYTGGFDGGTVIIPAGKLYRVPVRVAGTITDWTVIANTACTAVIDIRRAAFAGYPATASIVGAGNMPSTVAGTTKGTGVPVGWTSVQVNVGDILEYNVTSNDAALQLSIALGMARN